MKKETQEDTIRRLIAESERIGREQDRRNRGIRPPGIDWSWPEDLPHPLILIGALAVLVALCALAEGLPKLFGF